MSATEDGQEAIEFFTRGLAKAPIKVVGLSEVGKVFDMMKENKTVGSRVQ
ncbi:hypothetical protein B0T17DRAFT_620610 [Bombardia bombarda]|uniref:Uncharacterized protein n=1 Tax=Bombardia bombarda TaxID=252184 RepID=A0AA39U4T1_9PEZI|nr:hypothetical protein B0T17DRAFT_620610 [Bombardia bombarda]